MSGAIDKLLKSNDLGPALAIKGMTDMALDAMRKQTDTAIALDDVQRNYRDKQEELSNVRSEQATLRRELEERARSQQGAQKSIMAYAMELDRLTADKARDEAALQEAQRNLEIARNNEKLLQQLASEQKAKLKKSEETSSRLEAEIATIKEEVSRNLAIAYTGAQLKNSSLMAKFGKKNTAQAPSSEVESSVAEKVAKAEGISVEQAQRIIQAADKVRADSMDKLADSLDDASEMKKPLQIMADAIRDNANDDAAPLPKNRP